MDHKSVFSASSGKAPKWRARSTMRRSSFTRASIFSTLP